MDHKECVKKLIEIGRCFGFESVGRSYGKMYHMGNPDCVWYYKGKGAKELYKIAKGDKYKYIPFIAFEVPYSEKQKALRGTLVTLQLTNAAASIVVLIGQSAKYKSFMNKLIGRYSSTRFRIWTEKDVNELYNKAVKTPNLETGSSNTARLSKLESMLKNKHNITVGMKSLTELTNKPVLCDKGTIKVSGRSLSTGKSTVVKIPTSGLF